MKKIKTFSEHIEEYINKLKKDLKSDLEKILSEKIETINEILEILEYTDEDLELSIYSLDGDEVEYLKIDNNELSVCLDSFDNSIDDVDKIDEVIDTVNSENFYLELTIGTEYEMFEFKDDGSVNIKSPKIRNLLSEIKNRVNLEPNFETDYLVSFKVK